MAPKRANARDITPSSAATTQAGPTTAGTVPAATGSSSTKPHKTSTASLATKDGWEQVVGTVWNHYLEDTPQRTKLIDAFMAFLVVVGALQFLYCVLAGNYVSPENSSLCWRRRERLLTDMAGPSLSTPFSPALVRRLDSLS